MIVSIGEFKPGVVICEEEGVMACLENTGEQIESSNKLSPCSHSMLSPRSESVDDIIQNLITMKTSVGFDKNKKTSICWYRKSKQSRNGQHYTYYSIKVTTASLLNMLYLTLPPHPNNSHNYYGYVTGFSLRNL